MGEVFSWLHSRDSNALHRGTAFQALGLTAAECNRLKEVERRMCRSVDIVERMTFQY